MSQRKIVLAGRNVSLTEMTEADQPLFREWLQSPELRDQIDDARIPGPDDQMAWFRRVQQPDRKFFSLVTVPDGTLIGNCGFVDIDPTFKTATLRITIGNPASQGKGFGSEAVALMVRYAFETAGWDTLILTVLGTNARAIRTYEKAGFTVAEESMQHGKPMLTMTLKRQTAANDEPIKRGDVPCSVMMYVRNGGPRFLRCVQSCLALRDHVVLDGGSTDGTLEIAKKYGCRVIPQDPAYLDANGRIIDFGGVATQAYRATNEEWVVLLAADEELNPEFIEAVTKVIRSGKRGAYLVNRFFVINGRVMKYFSTKFNHQIRFCDKTSVLGFIKKVHERPLLAPGVVPQVLEGGYQYLPLTETPAELKRKYLRYLDLEKHRTESHGWLSWIAFSVRRVAIMIMLLSRSLWIRVIHDPRDCLPMSHEMLNIWYGWQFIKRSCPLSRLFRKHPSQIPA